MPGLGYLSEEQVAELVGEALDDNHELTSGAVVAALGFTPQPSDSDLTAIAALTTTTFGRALLELSNEAALRTAAALGTIATQNTNDLNTTLRVTGGTNPVSGEGMEMLYSGATGFVQAFDRGGAAWKDLLIAGLTVRLATSGTTRVEVNSTGLEPFADNTYYLGRNDDDSPKAWKGLILHDQTNGKTYRIEMIAGALTATDLTD